MEPCFLESFQRCWIAICVCGMSSLLSLCPRFETDVLILNDCTSTSCCVQSWSSFPALPADFYLKPAEELRHCGNGVEGRGRRKNSLRVTNPGRPVSPGCLHWWREEGLFFLENSSESFRHWGMCTEGGCWEDRVPVESQWPDEHLSQLAEPSPWLRCKLDFTSITAKTGF